MKVDIDFVGGTEKYSEFLSFLDSSNPVQSRLNGGSDSPNRGTNYKQLGRFILVKKVIGMVQEIERLKVSEFLKENLGGENYRVQMVVASLKKAGYNTVGIIREIRASGSDITWNDRDGYTSYEMTFYLDVINPNGFPSVLKIYFNISYDKQEAEVIGDEKAKTIAESVLKEHYVL